MTKAELVDTLAVTLQLTKHQTETVVNLFVQCITDALRQGDKVELRGFGSFRLRHRRARVARNPRTGAPVQMPAKQVPWFTAGKILHVMLNPQALPRRARAGARQPSPARAGRDARGHTAAGSQ